MGELTYQWMTRYLEYVSQLFYMLFKSKSTYGEIASVEEAAALAGRDTVAVLDDHVNRRADTVLRVWQGARLDGVRVGACRLAR